MRALLFIAFFLFSVIGNSQIVDISGRTPKIVYVAPTATIASTDSALIKTANGYISTVVSTGIGRRFGVSGEDATAAQNRSFSVGATYNVAVTGSGSGSTFNGTNSSSGVGVTGTSASGPGVNGNSTSGPGLYGTSSSSMGVYAISTSDLAASFVTIPSSTNTSTEVMRIARTSSGTAATGIGGYMAYFLETNNGSNTIEAARVAAKLTDATDGSEISSLEFWTKNTGGAVAKTFAITGAGALTYATNTSSAASLTLTVNSPYVEVFNGTTTTWTLPAVSGTNGLAYVIKNIGSGAITLNAAGGASEIYNTSAVNTLTINAGTTVELISNGTYFLVIN